MNSYTKIYSGSIIIILSMKNMLLEKNIIPIIKDSHESARLAGFGSIHGQLQDLYVNDDELIIAKKIINKITQNCI
tara:strand:- start:10137 stop:10364 length:228 start_codon:yes stop_codon:yes gene_type:complete